MMGNTNHIVPGRYMIPFHAFLPTNIPPSFTSRHGWVEYELTAQVKTTELLAFNIKSTETVTVLSDMSIAPSPPLLISQKGSHGGKIDMTVTLPNMRLNIGTINYLSLHLSNASTVPVTSLNIKISAKAKYWESTPRSSFSTETCSWVVFEKSIGCKIDSRLPLLPGKLLDSKIDIEIPHSTIPSLNVANSHLIDVTHFLYVHAEAEGFEKHWFSENNDVRLQIPVVLGHPFPQDFHHLVFLPAPENDHFEYGFNKISGFAPQHGYPVPANGYLTDHVSAPGGYGALISPGYSYGADGNPAPVIGGYGTPPSSVAYPGPISASSPPPGGYGVYAAPPPTSHSQYPPPACDSVPNSGSFVPHINPVYATSGYGSGYGYEPKSSEL
eukprot:TRINITY_DN1332_c0_g1_i3.p1 TRINITY_DN1332_c0_g1~~TRINITY_DN1332_c0_g1_i3.p1  ORF type:complete len:384 (+),score=39.70 TRINITY_DN1332_c0_g1_i3:1178-2329(+)